VYEIGAMQEVLLGCLKAHIGNERYIFHPLLLLPPKPLDSKPGPYWAIEIPGLNIWVALAPGHTVVMVKNGEKWNRWYVSPWGKVKRLDRGGRAPKPAWLEEAVRECRG
jgi:hypothetical protein